jgi:hypothetical protein
MKYICTDLIKSAGDKRFIVNGLLLLLTILQSSNLFACPVGGTDATADFNIDNVTPVVDEEVTFTDASSDAKNYRWNFGVDASPVSANAVGPHSVSYSTAGQKTITLSVDASDDRGAGDVAEKYVTVYGVYYYDGSGSPSIVSNWKTGRDGSGFSSADFSSGYQTFVIQSGQTCTTTSAWALSGSETNLVIEEGATLIASHAIGNATSNITMKLEANATYEHNNSFSFIWNGSVIAAPTSTISYGHAGDQSIAAIEYGHLKVSNGGNKILLGDATVGGNINLSGAKIVLGDHDLTLKDGATIIAGEGYSSSNMIVTQSSGSFIKEASVSYDFQVVYPVGSGGEYTPFQIADIQSLGAGSISVRTAASIAPGTNPTDLHRHWITKVSGVNVLNASVSFTYSGDELPNPISYEPKVFQNGSWVDIPGGQNFGANTFGGIGISDLTGIWTLREPLVTYYSYQSGSWNNANTWTTDPSGTLSVNPGVPSSNQRVIILNGRNVIIPNNTKQITSLIIQEGGVLDLGTTTGHSFGDVSGEGTLRLQTNNFPGGNFNAFTSEGGGTVEYYNPSDDFDLQQLTYNNLTFDFATSTRLATLGGDLTINGNLNVSRGRFQIGNNTTGRTVQIKGDVLVDNNGRIQLGTSNANHRFIVNGDFTNYGVVRFTNQGSPDYTGTPNNGRADVVFNNPSADQNLYMSGQSDFYRIEIDKGVDQTFVLNMDAKDVNNFKLFGRNNQEPGTNAPNIDNPHALGLQAGTVRLGQNVVIPALATETTYTVDEDAMLWLDGANVTFGTGNTANGTTLLLYGALKVSGNSIFNDNSKQGIVSRTTASITIEDGEVSTECVRTSYQSGTHRGAFNMSGGELTVRAAELPNLGGMSVYPAFTLPYSDNTINISGGSINILSPNTLNGGSGTNFSLLIGANPDNVSITGGEINVTVPSGRDAYMLSTAPLWDLNIISSSNNRSAQPRAYANSGTIPGMDVQPIEVKNNLTLINRAVLTSGNANANIVVGGDFIINNNTIYTPGNNITIFNGDGPQNFINNGALTNGFNHLDLSGKSDLTLNGANTLAVRGNLTLGKETTLRDNGRTITVAGNISNSGTHFRPVSGGGRIELSGNATQSIGGDGSGTFNNLSLNKNGGSVSMEADMTVTGDLRLVNNHRLLIGDNTLKMGAEANVYSAASGEPQIFTNNKMIVTGGLMSNGGVRKQFSNTNAFLYPFGFAIGTTYYYLPATIKFGSAPAEWGAVTSRPVNGRHHLAQGSNNALTTYWKTTSSGFSDIVANSIVHTYKYAQNFVQGTEGNYIPAAYNYGTNWRTINDVNLVNQATDYITFNAESSANGDYTAGLPTAFTGIPVLYTRDGGGDWNDLNTWSSESINGAVSSVLPSANTIVVIGDHENDHVVTMTNNGNTAGALFIANGSTLDLVATQGHNFAALPEETVAGSGTMRIASSYFPRGDFGDFLGESGGTVEYYVFGGNAYTMPVASDGTAIALSNYRNLIVNASGANITLPAVNFEVSENLIVRGSNQIRTNTTSEYTYSINRNLVLEGGTLIYRNENATSFVVYGDVNVHNVASFIVRNNGAAVSNTLEVYGNLINNGTFNMVRGSRNTATYFKGENDAVIEGVGATFNFYNLFVDKGTDATPVLTLKSEITTGITNPFLTLINGTFRVDNKDLIVTVTDGTTDFTVPSTAALSVNAGTLRVAYGNGNANLQLSGKLEVLGGIMEIGEASQNRNNSIEYAAAGKPEVFVSGGELYVNGQIRRPATTTSGSLNYIQTGGDVLIGGRSRMVNRGMLEIANSGSLFSMSDGTLTLARPSTTGTTFGDLYLRPQSHAVTGGTVQLGAIDNTAGYNFSVQSSTSIWNFTVGSNTAQTASLAVLPLVVNNDLTISNSSALLANGLGVDIAGSLINNNISSGRGLSDGGFQPGSSSQITRFNGTGNQFIQGIGTNVTNFANLEIRSANLELAPNSAVFVNKDLSLFTGSISDGGNIIGVSHNIYNVATHVSPSLDGGISIEGNQAQIISGANSVFGNVLMNNSNGANVVSDIRINGRLTFNAGALYINDYLLTFGENASIGGTPGNRQMVMLNGVLSDLGVRKLFAAGTAPEFLFPIGVQGKYTPAAYTLLANSAPGSITLRPINNKHAAISEAMDNELKYYWSVKAEGFSGLSVAHRYTYDEGDVVAGEALYVGGRYDYQNYSWDILNGVVDASGNTISFTRNYISGEYTAGYEANFVTKPVLYSRTTGNWSSVNTWSLTPGGGASGLTPDGNPVVISAGHVVTLNVDKAYTYSVELNGTLDVGTTLYHNMGHFFGGGTLALTSTFDGIFVLPGGRFDDFFENPVSTLEFKGNNDANLPLKPGNIYKPYQNVILSGTGQKNVSAEDMQINGNLTIRNGAVLNNSNYNRTIYIGGDWVNENSIAGGFISGRGTVVFVGTADQEFDVLQTELFYNVTMNSSGVLDMNQSAVNASLQVANKLTLTRGVIKSYDNKVVHISNTAINAVGGGNSNSYVDGPLTKSILVGQSFTFPVGNDGRYGRMAVQNTQGGVSPAIWSAQYFNENAYPRAELNLNTPITSVSNNEHWVLTRPAAASANIQLRWDDISYPGATSDAILRNSLRVVQYNNTDKKWTERGQSVNATNKTVSTSTRISTSDNIYSLGLSGVTASITDFTAIEVCDNGAVASIPVALTGSAPWILSYKVTGADTQSFTQSGITSPSYVIQLSGEDLAGAGNYFVSLVSVSDRSAAGIANAGSVNLVVNSTFVPVVSGAAMVGRNETRVYSTPQNGSNTYSWSWVGASGGTIASSGSASTNIIFGNTAGTYQLQVTETTAGSGCQVSKVFAVEVTSIPAPDINPKEPNICVGTTVTYSTDAISGNQYKWTVTGGTILTSGAGSYRNVASGGNTINVLWSSAGSGTVKVEERVGTGSVVGQTLESVEISPAVSNRTVTSEDTEVCHGSGTFIRVENSEANVSYRIKNLADNIYMGPSVGGTGSDLLIPTGDLLFDQSPYSVAVVATNLACELELTSKPQIMVKPLPVIALTSDADGGLFCIGTSVAFEATTGLTNFTFSINGADVSTSASNLFVSSSFSDGDVVEVRATDGSGCYGVSNPIALNLNSADGLWTGVADSDWDNTANWCNGVIPSSNSNLVISSKMVNQPVITAEMTTVELTLLNLTIEENASLMLDAGSKVNLEGAFTNEGELVLNNEYGVNRMVSLMDNSISKLGQGTNRVMLTTPPNQWFYLGSSVKNAIFSDFSAGEPNIIINIYRDKKWWGIKSTLASRALRSMEGMVTNLLLEGSTDNRLIEYTGELQTGPVSRLFTESGYNLLANPYPSFISWEDDTAWESSNVSGTIWYRGKIGEEMAFITYNRDAIPTAKVALYPDTEVTFTTETELSLIAPMQAVWISTFDPGVTVTVKPEARSHGITGSTLKSSSTGRYGDVIRIETENKYSRDGAVIYFANGSEEGVDKGDSEKYFNDSERIPEIYTRVGDKALSINGLSLLNEAARTIPLSVRNRITGDVTMKFDLSSYYGQHAPYLEDKETGAFINLLQEKSYTYTVSETGDNHDRFVLNFYYVTTDLESPKTDETDAGSAINIKSIAGKVLVSMSPELVQSGDAIVEVYTIDGRKVDTVPARSSRTLLFLPDEKGVYIIRAVANKAVKSERVINSGK